MTKTPESMAIKWWFRWMVIAVTVMILIIMATVGAVKQAPQGHYLLTKPVLGSLSLETVRFEVDYFTYLATVTGAITAALLAFLQFDAKSGTWRTATLVSVSTFMIAIGLVTFGYAMRNIWMVSQSPLDARIVSIDVFAAGPITAVMYFVGLLAMLIAVWDRLRVGDGGNI